MKNSWYIIVSFDKNGNFAQKVDQIVAEEHIQICRCGGKVTKKTSPTITAQASYPTSKCQQCGNEHFIFCTMYRHFHESLYELFDPLKCNIIEWNYSEGIVGDAYHTYANLILPYIDFQKNEVLFKKEKIFGMSFDKQGDIQENIFNEFPFGIAHLYMPNTKRFRIMQPLSKDAILKILEKKLVDFILRKPFEKSKIPGIFATDNSKQIRTFKELQFFMRFPHISTIEILQWDLFDEIVEKLNDCSDILELLDFVINHRREKSVRRALYKAYTDCMRNGEMYDPRVDFIFSRTIENTDLLAKAIEPNATKMERFKGENVSNLIQFILFLKRFYSEKSIVSFFANNDLMFDFYWKDTLTMFTQNIELIEKHFQKVKCKVKPMHDEVSRAIKTEYAKKHIQHFFYSDSIADTQINIKDFSFKLPQNSYELFQWSETLHNCLFSYEKAIVESRSIIYGVFIKKKLKYALEVVRHTLLQASGYNNAQIQKHHMQTIDLWLEKNHIEKMPEDFYLARDVYCEV